MNRTLVLSVQHESIQFKYYPPLQKFTETCLLPF